MIFGGHGDDPGDLQWFRRYFNSNRVGEPGGLGWALGVRLSH